ncbi:MAG: hypothetical protein OXC07_02660, partial [Kistimonas sp.]|nr:hypothetical protein [Kistimonas sp.]
ASEGPVVAGPVARTVGRNNSMRVQDASANRVEAEGQGSPVVASLGWGHLDLQNCMMFDALLGCPLKSTADDQLDQSNLTQNHVVARAAGMEARAHASLAGSYGQKDWHGVHRLEQRGVTGNTIKAQVNEPAAGLGLASLGLVHDLKDVEYATGVGGGDSRDNRKALFYIRQQKCSNNTVMGAAQERRREAGPVASLSLTADHSRNDSLARNLFRIMHNQVSENGLVVDRNAGASFNDTDAILVGSFEHVAPTPECPAYPTFLANRTCDAHENGSLLFLDETTPVALFLFSGGQRLLPMLQKNDSALVWMSDIVCDFPSMIDEAAYAFGGDKADANYDCLRNPRAENCPSFARPCCCQYQALCCNNTDTSGALSCQEWDSDCLGAADNRVQVIVNSTDPGAWEMVNRFFCEGVPWVFEGKERLCDWMTPCHNPGEELYDLVPTGRGGTPWLLVTRQTWPAGSKGNDSNADLFRVLSFSALQDSQPLWNSDAFTGARNEAGHLYADTRGMSAGSGPLFALADADSLVYVYQIATTGQERPRLRCTDLSGTEPCTVDWPLPAAGAELMLVSREDDGVSVWIKRADAVVERFLLEDIQKNGTAAPVSSFRLRSESDVEREPLALARHKDWLYSLHATSVEDATGREFQIRRWNISSPTAILDRALKRCARAISPGRLVVTDSGLVQHVQELGIPVGEVSFKPSVPVEGGCLKWKLQDQEHDVLCAVRPGGPEAAEIPVEAIASVVLVVTGGCIGLTAGVCAHKAYHYQKKKRSRPVDSVAQPGLPLRADLEASPCENIYEEIGDIHVYEDVSRVGALVKPDAEDACAEKLEHPLPSGTESGGTQGYAQLNAEDADVMLPEHPLPSGTESGGAEGYAQLNAEDADVMQPELQPLAGTDPGGAGGYANLGGMAAGTQQREDPPQPLSEPQSGGASADAHPGDVDVCAQQSSSAGIESSALGLREEPGVGDPSDMGNGRRGVAALLPPSTSTTTPPARAFSLPSLLPGVTAPDGDDTAFPPEKSSAFQTVNPQ